MTTELDAAVLLFPITTAMLKLSLQQLIPGPI
jgi:hypothetical protein